MKIEGYLFIPHRGQYRFSFEVFEVRGNVRADEIKVSNRAFDYFWDIDMRSRPTLYELIETPLIRKEFEREILNLFKDKHMSIMQGNSTFLKQMIGGGYVEYRAVA